MEKTVLILTFLSYWCSINALFTVEIARSVYVTQYGSTVNMTCTFPVAGGLRMKDLKVYWHQISSSQMVEKEIYAVDSGKENLTLQDVSYRGRATLLKDELYKGQAVLEISNVKLTDAGTYRCLIIYGGADYKQVTLQVQVPFRKINISISGQEKRELICQSEGYPKPEVMWQHEGQDLSDKANTTYRINPEQLYEVTSVLRVNTTVNATYRCIFWNKELQENSSESFSFSDKDNLKSPGISEQKAYYGTMLAGCVLAVFSLALLIWMQRNGHCRKPTTLYKDRKKTTGCFVCERNPSNHIWKVIRNFCLHLTHSIEKENTTEDHNIKIPIERELKMPLSMDITDASERLYIPSEENRAYPPRAPVNKVEVDVHHGQEMDVKEM
ncbi:programmed cell death 1 ligand 1 [Microcaecilia unicolor]|uniref:Programmed cell death 1 ligand 1-like n=1 Tax=Microcaecilia unicolor TaxID=1415580 RepID=A0A6P7WYA7_9AMPH|nr:programmed cell death 1 ligand 1-like [Microcaecilia unicolor]XP_030048233.1 programmed cell death 1 ligand 1-like [Microcaecilia unicolor]